MPLWPRPGNNSGRGHCMAGNGHHGRRRPAGTPGRRRPRAEGGSGSPGVGTRRGRREAGRGPAGGGGEERPEPGKGHREARGKTPGRADGPDRSSAVKPLTRSGAIRTVSRTSSASSGGSSPGRRRESRRRSASSGSGSGSAAPRISADRYGSPGSKTGGLTRGSPDVPGLLASGGHGAEDRVAPALEPHHRKPAVPRRGRPWRGWRGWRSSRRPEERWRRGAKPAHDVTSVPNSGTPHRGSRSGAEHPSAVAATGAPRRNPALRQRPEGGASLSRGRTRSHPVVTLIRRTP